MKAVLRNFRVAFTSFSRSKERNLATKLKYRLQFLVALRRFFSILLSATNDKQNLSYYLTQKQTSTSDAMFQVFV